MCRDGAAKCWRQTTCDLYILFGDFLKNVKVSDEEDGMGFGIYFGCQKIWCLVTLGFGWRGWNGVGKKQQTSSKKTGLILFPSMLLGKTTPPWPLMSVISIKKIYMYDHAAACLACRKSLKKTSFKATICLGFFTPNLRHFCSCSM